MLQKCYITNLIIRVLSLYVNPLHNFPDFKVIPHKNRVKTSLLCISAHRDVPLCFSWSAAMLFGILHNILVLHQIIDQGYYRKDQCDPHNNIREDL